MLGKVLFSNYHDSGSSTPTASYKIATDKMILRYLQLGGKRLPSQDASSLMITYFNLPVELGQRVILSDQLFLEEDYKIQSAERKLFVPNTKERITSPAVPTGIFIYNFEDKEEWEKRRNGDAMNVDERTRVTLVEQINAVLNEFKERFSQVLKRRVARVAELYPIDPEKFFGNGYGAGIGPVFDETFWVVDDGFGGRGLTVLVNTDKYALDFEYCKDHPKIGTAQTLSINRGNFGFSLDFDEALCIARVQEIGAANIAIDKSYHKSDFKTGVGKILYDNATRVWEEFRREFSVDERMKSCNGLTAEELSRAEPVVAYMTRKEKFPFLKR